MDYLRGRGYPVPAVERVSDDGRDLVMEHIEGRSMVEALGRAPWSVRAQAKTLADLHHRLHDLEAPDFLDPAPVGSGSRVLHLDLHPLNVILGPNGPIVIDWTGASAGDPAMDVALAWILMSAGEIPGEGIKPKVLGWGRALLVNAFTAKFDLEPVVQAMRDVVAWKVRDPNMSAREIAAMWSIAERAEARIRRRA
jgi:aminoglycoside phosphotransferase (APT) family kinase protein